MNTPEIINQVIEHGAVKLPEVVHAHELAHISSRGDFHYETLPRLAPQLGSFIKEFVESLPVDPDIRLSRDLLTATQQDTETALHIDSIYDRGFSFLIPLSGPKASFYYSDEKLHIPSQLLQAKHFTYGPGDIAVLRQRLKIQDGITETRVSQIYHAGLADEERELMMVDMVFGAPIAPTPSDSLEVAA